MIKLRRTAFFNKSNYIVKLDHVTATASHIQTTNVARVISVFALNLPYNLILHPVTDVIPEALTAECQLNCLRNITNAEAHYSRFVAVNFNHQLRFIKF